MIEICLMALDLLAVIRKCSIPHMPETPLELRIGIHSGETFNLGNESERGEGTGGVVFTEHIITKTISTVKIEPGSSYCCIIFMPTSAE